MPEADIRCDIHELGYATVTVTIDDDQRCFVRSPDGRWLGPVSPGAQEKEIEEDQKRNPEMGTTLGAVDSDVFQTEPDRVELMGTGDGFSALFRLGFPTGAGTYLLVWESVVEQFSEDEADEATDLAREHGIATA